MRPEVMAARQMATMLPYGGTIEVATEPGSFTDFVIRLPRTMTAQAK
jgi:chemotaxis protein histidine kinase CheA